MDDNTTLEYFLSLLDEGERILTSDPLSEEHKIFEYELQNSPEPEEEILSPDSCRGCQAWRGRGRYIRPIEQTPCKILCILTSPLSDRMLSEKGKDYFFKWFKALGIDEKLVSLTTLVKCPIECFKPDYANACKCFLRSEMDVLKPENLLLLGEDVARYMLRKNSPMEELRGKRYLINRIPTFVTYSPEDLASNVALRVPIWDDLKFMKEYL